MVEEKSEPPPVRPPVRFDLFELDAGKGQLRRSGLPVDLSPQALKILVMLAERPGDLVARKEIKEALWPGQSYGDFDSRLNFAIKKLREALGDDAEQPRYIQTIRNAGYRFIAPLRETTGSFVVRDQAHRSEPSPQIALPEATQASSVSRRGVQVLALVTVAIMVVAATTVALRQREPRMPVSTQLVVPPSMQGDAGPEIASVTPILPQPRQTIVIKGRGFGLHVPYVHTDSPYLSIRDDTAHWAAGRIIPWNYDDVTLDVESWTETEIVVTGFSGQYGRNGWTLSPGDSLEVAVWNPQSGAGPARYHLTVSPNAP